MNYTKHFSTRVTPQSEPIPGSSQVANSAGGFSWQVDCWARMQRFLILGSEGGSYYATEKKLTKENALAVSECLRLDPERAVQLIVDVSDAGRAPKNDPAIFALAIAAGHADEHARRLAEAALPKVARIGTHLFQFIEAVKSFRGWGKGLRKAISRWYETHPSLALQVAKYQQRNRVSHRDALRLAHVRSCDPERQAILRWAVCNTMGERQVVRTKDGPAVTYPAIVQVPEFLQAVDEAKTANTGRLVKLIEEFNLPRECIPTEKLNEIDVWEALLVKMPLTAMVRNLGKMSAIGLLKPMSAGSTQVCVKLGDVEYIKKSRLHPLAILIAAKTYAQGHGDKGKLKWTPVSQINDALDAAFYLAFGNVEPAGKRTLIGLDVSGSMNSGSVAGSSLAPREAAAAMAMVIAKTEPIYQIMAFSHRFVHVDISKCSRLSDVITITDSLSFGGTDCALPMTTASLNGWMIDTFITLTDSESWAGPIHPHQALLQYRQKTSIPARAICVGMVANKFTVLDPDDTGSLNIVGFDSAAPVMINDFSAGRI